MKKIVLGIFLLCYSFVEAQTVVWQMAPTDYNSIERISQNLFKVVRNGKIGLIYMDGTVVTPTINDNISDCYEHKALITCGDEHGERITGCLTDEGIFYGYSAKYYTLNGQKFFSDGLLSVADESGKLGYIDEKGNQMVGFDAKYARIKPFSEGYATVKRGQKYVLINKEGEEIKFVHESGVGAKIVGCTNVYNGKAYVYDEYGGSDRSYFIYDTSEGGPVKKTKRVKDTAMDYLFCYQSATGRSKEVPFEKMKTYSGTKGLTATYSNGVYGYVSDDNVLVPEQFSSASQFEDGLAIVSVNGLTGILKYVEGASFGVSIPTSKLDFYAGNNVLCSFILSVPSIWQGGKLDIIVKDKNGSTVTTTNNDDYYTFSAKPTSSEQADYSIIVSGEGICLYKGVLTYTFNKRERCSICGKDMSLCEYKGNHPEPQKDNPCPTCGKSNCKTHCYDCGKTIKECEYGGVH